MEKRREIGGIVLAVPIHHGGEGAGGGKKPSIEGRSLAEIFRKVNDADVFFLVEERGSAVLAAVVDRDDFGPGHGGAGLGQDGGNIFLFVIKGNDEGELGRHGLLGMKERRQSGKPFWQGVGSEFLPGAVGQLANDPGREKGDGNGGENVGGVVVSRIDAAKGGQGEKEPGPAEGGAPDQPGGEGGGGGIGDVGGGKRAAVEGVLFWKGREANNGMPALRKGAGADFAHAFDGLVGARPVKHVFEGVAEEGINDGNGKKTKNDPSAASDGTAEEEVEGEEEKERRPKTAIGEQVKELIEDGVVKGAVDPAENTEVQRINLGDQVPKDKLGKMVRQVAWVGVFLFCLQLGWAEGRSVAPAVAKPEGEEMTPTPRQMQNFLWKTLVMKDLKLRGQVQYGEKKIPIVVRTKDRLLQFEFQDRPLQIRVRFAPEGSLIQRRAKEGGEWQVVTGVEKTKAVAGTDLAYEDLGIDFLRWPDPQPRGEDSVMMLDCWVYEVTPPVESNYAKVRYWISKGYKTMIRADGLNGKGQPIKRFTFHSVIEAEDTVVVGEMKVAKLTPGTDLSVTRTFVQVESVEKGSGL